MPIKKRIAIVVMLIVLHHFLAAWAAGEDTSPYTTTTQQEESQTSREQPSGPEKQAATAPLVESLQSAPSDTSSIPEISGPERGFFDALHGEISHRLLTTAVWLDSFFADERSIKEENRSYIRTRYDIFKEEKSSATYKPIVDMRP